jgi:hypothetical protein
MKTRMAILIILLFCVTARAAENPDYRRLAEHYAPVIYQETKSSVLDYITKFDYDGDWNGATTSLRIPSFTLATTRPNRLKVSRLKPSMKTTWKAPR